MEVTPQKVLIFSIIYRLTAVFVVQTSYVPDEYWQSLEVAHKFTFGYGYLTWEWRERIRSYIYPFFISIIYKILDILHLDYPTNLIYTPRIFMALLSAYADYRFHCWTKSTWATVVLYANWFWFYCATRTLSNTLETALTIIALSYFPFRDSAKEKPSKDCKFLWIVGLMCAIRPTTAITWIPLCTYHLLYNEATIAHLISQYIKIGLITLAYSIAIDSYCYGTLVFTPWNFFKINIVNEIATFYGTHGLLWYFIMGLPAILGVYYIYFPFATITILSNETNSTHKNILIHGTIYWTLIVYSAIRHKEFRFILPVLPMIISLCTSVKPPKFLDVRGTMKNILIGIFLITNIVTASFVSLIHQRGPLDAMDVLRLELDKYEENYLHNNHRRNALDVLFLTPCHALPLYSHLHKNVTTKFLTCEPNLYWSTDYVDEADEFFKDPMRWINQQYNFDAADFNPLKLPAFFVIFDATLIRVVPLTKYYKRVAKLTYTYFQPDGNYGKNIYVFKYIYKHHKISKYAM